MIVCALRKRHPTPSRQIQRLLNLLDATKEEIDADLAYAKSMQQRWAAIRADKVSADRVQLDGDKGEGDQ
jgi:hypothetical protein